MNPLATLPASTLPKIEPWLLSEAVAVCPESFAIVESGRLVCANPAFARLYGYPIREELAGRSLRDFVPGGDRCTRDTGDIDGCSQTTGCGYPRCEFTAIRRDGQLRHMQASCASLRADGRAFLVVNLQDITHRERRRLVRESESRYRAIFKAAAVGIMQCTTTGRVVECNPALEKMLGYSGEELRRLSCHELIHANDIVTESQTFRELIAGKADSYQTEARFICKDKSVKAVRLTISLVRGPDGNPEFVIGMAEDISDHKRAEQRLREAQKMEAIGRLVGGVAHDFNNLLTGIMLYCDLLLAGLKQNSHLRHHAKEIRLAGQQGAALIQQLMAVARKQAVEPRELTFNQVISEMRNLLDRLIGENIRLKIKLADNLWRVKMDPARVQQVVLNLVLNARDAMPQGGELIIETHNAEIEATGTRARRMPCAELVVSDTGCGMDEETQSHLFEMFFTTKEPGSGNGLGLVTVQDIIKEQGGTIQVNSKAGHGTTFRIQVPRVEKTATAEPEVTRACASDKGNATILLAEDNRAIRNAARRVLRRHGYEVIAAENGAEALQVFASDDAAIDLVITDLMMPGMSGRELVHRLKRVRPDIRVLFVSGYEHREKTSDPEDTVLFRKPFTGDALLQKISHVLQQPSPIP